MATERGSTLPGDMGRELHSRCSLVSRCAHDWKIMKSKFDQIVTITLTIAIVVMADVILQRAIANRGEAEGGPVAPPELVAGWEDYIRAGSTIGASWAPVKIIEFGDFQCPACRGYQRILDRIRERFGDRVAVVYIHYPLPYHKFALEAAVASECSRRQGSFDGFVSLVYEKQDSLGIKTFGSFASEAGVTNSKEFEQCLAGTIGDSVVSPGRRSAEALGIDGTPTIIVNGWRYKNSPQEALLTKLIKDILAGRLPS